MFNKEDQVLNQVEKEFEIWAMRNKYINNSIYSKFLNKLISKVQKSEIYDSIRLRGVY